MGEMREVPCYWGPLYVMRNIQAALALQLIYRKPQSSSVTETVRSNFWLMLFLSDSLSSRLIMFEMNIQKQDRSCPPWPVCGRVHHWYLLLSKFESEQDILNTTEMVINYLFPLLSSHILSSWKLQTWINAASRFGFAASSVVGQVVDRGSSDRRATIGSNAKYCTELSFSYLSFCWGVKKHPPTSCYTSDFTIVKWLRVLPQDIIPHGSE